MFTYSARSNISYLPSYRQSLRRFLYMSEKYSVPHIRCCSRVYQYVQTSLVISTCRQEKLAYICYLVADIIISCQNIHVFKVPYQVQNLYVHPSFGYTSKRHHSQVRTLLRSTPIILFSGCKAYYKFQNTLQL